MLACVQIEHEIDERAREPRTRAEQQREAGARDLRRTLEVDDAECRPEVPVRSRGEVERGRIADATDFEVLGRVRANGHRCVRQVRHREQDVRPLLLDRLQLGIELLDALAALAVGFEDPAGVLSKSFQTCDFLPGGVLRPLEAFDVDDERAAALVERGQLGEEAARVEATVLQGCSDAVRVVAQESRVDHAEILY